MNAAAARLEGRLRVLDLETLGISEYNHRYLGSKIPDLRAWLQLYGELLYLSIVDNETPLEDFVLVDYGGGSGVVSLLAAELGIGTVVYSDIYEVCCTDVRRLFAAFGITANHVVCGDADELVSYLKTSAIIPDAVVSYDVLEHIYDVESHFRVIGQLPGGFRVVYISTANSANRRCVRARMRMQDDAEFKNRERQWGHKDRDSLQSYLETRHDIIHAHAPDLADETIRQLASSTRGLIKGDIEACVDEFRAHGDIAYRAKHPTNTCDPYTGNWCEQLIDLEWLAETVTRQGFSPKLLPGFYLVSGSLPMRWLKRVLNAAIRLSGSRGLSIAPAYVLCSLRVRRLRPGAPVGMTSKRNRGGCALVRHGYCAERRVLVLSRTGLSQSRAAR